MKGRRGRKQMMRNGERDKPGPRGGRGGRGESRENEKAALENGRKTQPGELQISPWDRKATGLGLPLPGPESHLSTPTPER